MDHGKQTYKDYDIDNWPQSWAGIAEDIEYGNKIIQIYKPFINQLKEKKLSRKTINSYIDDLWVLGGYIIKMLHHNESYRHDEPQWLIPRFIDSFDGPYISDMSEDEQHRFDRTYRKLYKYVAVNYLRNESDAIDFD
jgi:hypothetical protein